MQSKFDHISMKIWSKLVEFVSDLISDLTWSDHLIWSDRISSDRNSWSNFLIAFLAAISWSNFLIHLSDHALVGLVRISIELGRIACPIWSLISADLIIWSDLFGCDQIEIIDQISWSHFLFKFVDQISWSICPIMISFHTDLFKFLVQLCWSFFPISSLFVRIVFSPRSNFLFKFVDPPFRSCAFFFWPLFRSPSMDIDGSWLVYIYIYIYIYIYTYIAHIA